MCIFFLNYNFYYYLDVVISLIRIVLFHSCHVSLQVADLGCCECQLLKELKFDRQMKLLVGVDINGAKVKKHMYMLHS